MTAPPQAPLASFSADGVALAVHGLRKSYGSRLALDGLDLSVPSGVVYGFLGPNGAGKTTLMRCLVGLIRPDAGSLSLLGAPYTWRDRKRLYRVGALVESPVFYSYLSGRDNLRTLAATGGPVPKGRVDEVLGFVGLHDRGGDKVGNYSLGMKQRLGIAAAMLSDPDLLLLDEPANGLDPGGIVAMRQTLRYLTANGKTVFISSHILPEVQQLADVIGIVDRGKLVREGRLEQLLNEGSLVRVRVSETEIPRAMELLGQLQVTAERDLSDAAQVGWLTVRVPPDRAREINRVLAQGGIYASALESGNDLETVFLQLTASAPPPPSQAGPAGPPPGWGERG